MPNENEILQKLLLKILTYRITRNLDKELESRKITHLELSRNTGGNTNWFNRRFNELKDIKLSTFVKIIVAINKIISENSKFEPVEVNSVLTPEVLLMASVSIDLAINDIDYLLANDEDFKKFFLSMQFYVNNIKALNNVIAQEEIAVFEKIMIQIND
ncbi:hypothetical protein ABC255_16880 [Neobacillus sp. 3P2-tot-E-2]|uniref:hypothetical protein n=1 Tax=Neobacillus sp. 3P2-tot-E-2 TaxID=3132212 RepID=UPI0039A2594E